MLRRSEITDDSKQGSHHFCNRLSTGLNIGQNHLYPVTEIENEPSAFTSKQLNNASKLAALKRRSYAVNALYKNVMNQRNSTSIYTIEHNNLQGGSKDSSKNSTRPSSIANLTSSISVTVNSNDQPKYRNPIDHYEQNMNFALRPKSSSTIDLLITQRPEMPERSRSGSNIKSWSLRHKDGGGSKLSGIQRLHYDEDIEDNDDSGGTQRDDLLCNEIANALHENIFQKEVAFDNKWGDNSAFENYADRLSQTSSNQSPLTKTLKNRQNSNSISRRDSIILEDFERDLDLSTNRTRHISGEALVKNSSRLQLKLNTMKMRYESVQDTYHDSFGSSMTAVSNCISDESDKRPTVYSRYWTTNIDVKTKILSEKITRELQSVRRTAVDDANINNKLVSSRLKRMMKEGHHGRGRAELAQDFSTEFHSPPLLKTVNSTHSDVMFLKFFESTKKDRNEDEYFQEKVSQLLHDDILKDSLLLGRDYSSKIWIETEKFEFS